MFKDVDKKDLVIVGLVLVFMLWWFGTHSPTPPAPPPAPTNGQQEPGGAGSDSEKIDGTGTETTGDETTANGTTGNGSGESAGNGTTGNGSGESAGTETERPGTGEATAPVPEYVKTFQELPPNEPVVLQSGDLVDYHFAPDAGGIVRAVLHRHLDNDREGPMILGAEDFPVHELCDASGRPVPTSNALIVAREPHLLRISRLLTGTSVVVHQSWQLPRPGTYEIAYEMRFENVGQEPQKLAEELLSIGSADPLGTPKGFMGAGGIDQRADVRYADKKSPKFYPLSKVEKQNEKQSDEEWLAKPANLLATQNKYFGAVAVSTGQALPGSRLWARKIAEGPFAGDSRLDAAFVLPPQVLMPGEISEPLTIAQYLGAKRHKLLSEFGHDAEDVMNFDLFLFWHLGLMEKVSLGLLWFMSYFADLTGSFGIAIIITTFCLRLVFWPLIHRSTIMSRQMQKLQPLMAEIREKYKDDPQRQQMKMMELYKEHKVNPLSGCLPVLVQIPVFFALFNVLRSAVELRLMGFLWITDLSQPDSVFGLPIYPMAILMGLTMLTQQRMVPTSADPAQQKMMLFMTAIFMVMLYSMPSGLTLYWTMTNICSIIQYRITYAILGKPGEEKSAGQDQQAPGKT